MLGVNVQGEFSGVRFQSEMCGIFLWRWTFFSGGGHFTGNVLDVLESVCGIVRGGCPDTYARITSTRYDLGHSG